MESVMIAAIELASALAARDAEQGRKMREYGMRATVEEWEIPTIKENDDDRIS
jgi:hypothetical protein